MLPRFKRSNKKSKQKRKQKRNKNISYKFIVSALNA
nr:MAG TPA: hypothetical protein [Caudoviricetes sp.]